MKLTLGTTKWLIITLDWGVTERELDWTADLVVGNSDHRVILTMHNYLYHDKTVDGVTGSADSSKPNPDWDYSTDMLGNSKTEANPEGPVYNPDGIWERLASRYANIDLVLSGHVPNSAPQMSQLVGVHGNTITQILVDPQSMDLPSKNTSGTGMVAMLYFSNDGKDVRVEYISTVETATSADGKDVYYNAATNNKSYALMTLPVESEYGVVFPEYADATKYPFAVFGESGNFIGAFESFLDTENPYNNGGAIYAAKTYLSSNKWTDGSYGENAKSVTVWLRGDYEYKSNESYDNITQVMGTITLDLDGHTITMPNDRAMFPSTVKVNGSANVGYEARFEVINGKIVLGNTPLISFRGTDGTNDVDVSQRLFTHSFSNVEFIASSNSSNLLVGYSQNSDDEIFPKLIFNGCIFDLTNAPAGAVVFNLKDNYGFVKPSLSVNGSEFKSDSTDFVVISEGEGSYTFAGYNGEYTKMTLPATAAAPVSPVAGLEYVVESTNGTTTTYVLVPSASVGIDFTPKASITLDSNLIFNIYLPANGAIIEKVTLNGKEITLGDAIDGKYLIATALEAKEAAKTLTLVVTLNVDGTSLNGTFTFSTVKYVSKLLNTAGVTTAEQTLAKDMLAYVKSAYEYFNSADKATVATEIDKVLGNYSATFAPVNGDSADESDIIKSTTFVLDATPRIRFYFEKDTNVSEYTFKIGNSVIGSEDITAGVETNAGENLDCPYVDISLYAYRMIESITITKGNLTATYHINHYYNSIKDNSNLELVDVVTKFYSYCVSASNYRNSVISK